MSAATSLTQPEQREPSREALLAAAVLMYDRGLTIATVGNVSVRNGDNVVITPTRRYFDELAPADLISAPIAGFAELQSPALISREWRMHAAVYAASPDIYAIAHTHSAYAIARSFDPTPLRFETEERAYLGIDDVAVLPAAEGGSLDLALLVSRHLCDNPVCLLARHGVVAAAQTPRDAVELCRAVEHQARIQWLLDNSSRRPLTTYPEG